MVIPFPEDRTDLPKELYDPTQPRLKARGMIAEGVRSCQGRQPSPAMGTCGEAVAPTAV